MGTLITLIQIVVFVAAVIQVSSWVFLFLLNHLQGKIENKIRAKVTQPEYYLIKWSDDPKWAKIERIKSFIFPTILITGIFLLVVGFIANGLSSEGSCYSRFEDYCSTIE
jgi:hypothetical protein